MIKQRKAVSRLIHVGRVTVETKGDVGDHPDGIQLQKFDQPRLRAD
jgi:hypothetical protein